MNFLDQAIAAVSPRWGVRRAQARHVMAQYEAARPSRQRLSSQAMGSINTMVQASASAVRAQARDLERNHDIVRGALRVLVNNVVGANGIGIEPQPRTFKGKVHEDYANQLRVAWVQWQKKPEVTHRLRWPLAQRLMAYTWLRDGEAFAQQIMGPLAHSAAQLAACRHQTQSQSGARSHRATASHRGG